jgi:DNA-binding response OmpR family regulator
MSDSPVLSVNDAAKVFLLVEDSSEDAFLFDLQFRRSRAAKLCIVRDGEDAIHYLEGKAPYDDRGEFPLPHVILLDLKMPKRDGIEVLKWLRNQTLGGVELTPVVVISDSTSEEVVKQVYKCGGNCFMSKPVNPDEMKERIRALIAFWCEHIRTIASASVEMTASGQPPSMKIVAA